MYNHITYVSTYLPTDIHTFLFPLYGMLDYWYNVHDSWTFFVILIKLYWACKLIKTAPIPLCPYAHSSFHLNGKLCRLVTFRYTHRNMHSCELESINYYALPDEGFLFIPWIYRFINCYAIDMCSMASTSTQYLQGIPQFSQSHQALDILAGQSIKNYLILDEMKLRNKLNRELITISFIYLPNSNTRCEC